MSLLYLHACVILVTSNPRQSVAGREAALRGEEKPGGGM